MHINLKFDPSALSAPQSFRDAVQAAADIIDTTFSDPITINLAVGYGELTANGTTETLPSGVAESQPLQGGVYNYNDIRNLLIGSLDSAVVAGAEALPQGSLQGRASVEVWSAEEKALGLISPNDSGLDGATGFATDIPNSLLVGVALHELTHAMGRCAGASNMPDIFDFYRFAKSGAHVFGSAFGGYFSLDGGGSDLGDYGLSSDNSDFDNNGRLPYDPFEEFYVNGTLQNLTNTDILQIEALGFHLRPALTSATMSDFSQDHISDLVFRDPLTGAWGYSVVGAGTWHAMGGTAPSYDVVGVGDFNGDGIADVLFHEASSGAWGYLAVDAAGGETWRPMGLSNASYSVVAVGDFNGDGISDIAFRNGATGAWGYMTLDGHDHAGWVAMGLTNPTYSVVGTGDFDGDHVSDLLFRSRSTGAWGYMTLDGQGGEAWHPMGIRNSNDTMAGVGDFNHDGVSDVAFRNNATGAWGYMTLDGAGGGAWHDVGNSSPAYSVVSVGDYNGDGYSDLLFRDNVHGNYGYMALEPGGVTVWTPVAVSNPSYFVY